MHAVTGVPGQVQITDVQSDSFSLSWMQPDDVPCQLIQGYRVQCRRDRVSIIYTANQTDTSSIRVNSLVPFTPYNCCVTSYNNNGGRERENCSNAMTLAGTISITVKPLIKDTLNKMLYAP